MNRLISIIGAFLCLTIIAHAQLTTTGAGKNPGGGGGGSVAFDQAGPEGHSGPGVTTLLYNLGFTITAGMTNPALAVIVIDCGTSAISAVNGNWDTGGTPQTLTQIGSVSSGAGQVFLFGLRNPTSGMKQLTINWTTASQVAVLPISFSGVNQTSDGAAFTNFNSATNAAPISVTVTSAASNIVIAGMVSVANFTSTNNTQIFIDNACNINATAGNRAAGAATVTMTGNPGSIALSAIAGMSISP